MTEKLTRRGFLAAGTSLAVPFLMPATARPAFAQASSPRWARLMPGVSVMVDEFIRHHRLDEEAGFTLQRTPDYTSLPNYYGDFDAGAFDLCNGAWDHFAVRYMAGVPIRLLCLISMGDGVSSFAARRGVGIETLNDLRGRTVAAPQSSGTYRTTRAVLREAFGFDLEEFATVQNAINPAAAVGITRAGAADAALAWEPIISDGLAQDDNLFLLARVGEIYRSITNQPLPFFAIAVRNELVEREPEVLPKVLDMYRMAIEGMVADPSAAADIIGESAGFARDVVHESIASGRLGLSFAGGDDPETRSLVMTAAEFLMRNELIPQIPDEGLFVST